ncbi:MAG: phosphodiesterase [Niameybacter sp.]|nr:phosphodiesterase [Niameybacter sp.]
MKYIIFSDIHGSASRTKKVLEIFEKEQCDKMIILGDVLYHGPRNDLPEGHGPKEVVTLLNHYKDRIICVRGNCEAEVDQMVLEFACMETYTRIIEGERTLFATHGHHYNPEKLPMLKAGDVFLYGHTHLWELSEKEGIRICNPGSISLPKENRPATYALYNEGKLSVYTLEGECLAQE